jgi:hypothetical protein
MKLRKYFLAFALLLVVQNIDAQIKNLDDFIVKTEELRMLTQRVAKNYIMSGVLTNKPIYGKKLERDKTQFNDVLLMLTEKAPNDEIEIELQKLNLSWMLMNNILKKKYDGNAASKVLNYAEKMEKEINGISDMVSQLSKIKSVKLLRVSSTGRMLSQKILLYYIANRLKIKSKVIPERFNKAKEEMYEVITLLTDYAKNDPTLRTDEGVAMYMEMIKDSFDKSRKGMTLKGKVHPVSANMLSGQMTQSFDLLTKMIYERFNE